MKMRARGTGGYSFLFVRRLGVAVFVVVVGALCASGLAFANPLETVTTPVREAAAPVTEATAPVTEANIPDTVEKAAALVQGTNALPADSATPSPQTPSAPPVPLPSHLGSKPLPPHLAGPAGSIAMGLTREGAEPATRSQTPAGAPSVAIRPPGSVAGEGNGSLIRDSADTEVDPAGGVLGASQVSPFRSVFIHVWPAVALGGRSLARFLQSWESATLRLIAGEGAGVVGGDPLAADGQAVAGARISSSSSHFPALGPWLGADPALPLAVFWIALVGGSLAIYFAMRSQLGLSLLSKRWRL
jgi:hypothetical protein